MLEQLQKPLSTPPGELPRGQPSLWHTGAGLDKGCRLCVLGGQLVRSLVAVSAASCLIRHSTPPAVHCHSDVGTLRLQ